MSDQMLSLIKHALRVLALMGQAVDQHAWGKSPRELEHADQIITRTADTLIAHCNTLSSRAVWEITHNAAALVSSHMMWSDEAMEGYKAAMYDLQGECLSIPAPHDADAFSQLCAFYGQAIRFLQPDYVESNDNRDYN